MRDTAGSAAAPAVRSKNWRRGSFIGVLLPYRARAKKGRGRAMRAWIDRTNDGLSGMPADGISLPPKKGGPRHVPLGPTLRLGYINHAIDGREHDRCGTKRRIATTQKIRRERSEAT